VRIALLHYAAHPVVGGVENVMREHARLMARSGHQVRVIAGRGAQADPDVEFTQMSLLDSVAPEVLAVKASLDTGVVPTEFHALSRQIELQLRDVLVGFDWLFAHNVCSLNKNLALTSALRRMADSGPARLVLWHHDLAWSTPRYRSELHDGDPWNLLRNDWPSALQVTISEARRRELADLLEVAASRIRVIPNGIDPYRFLEIGPEASAISEQLGFLEADPLIVLPARVTPRKNIELAVRVLGHLLKRYPRALLVVTGPVGAHNTRNREYLDFLAQLSKALGVQDRAIFLTLHTGAPVSDDVVRQIYRLSDALFLPSREEGFGIPILEAGLTGIPIFCTDIPALVELAMDNANYFSVDADPADVADQVMTVLGNDRIQGLRKRVHREYAWDQIYATHLAPLLKGSGQ
jgi:glycosyltransferase involved in cell wall biosynthesis